MWAQESMYQVGSWIPHKKGHLWRAKPNHVKSGFSQPYSQGGSSDVASDNIINNNNNNTCLTALLRDCPGQLVQER